MDKHDLLFQCQYGFRKKCSTQDTLIDIVNRIQLKYCQEAFIRCYIYRPKESV